eukprot:GEMP01097353.1.p2 GENE.GEMP01097353.1~~GEMP01097353.1.p2  ORF type:complete len:138 (+),score=32.33 GEMP01097353.1:76-489(+)
MPPALTKPNGVSRELWSCLPDEKKIDLIKNLKKSSTGLPYQSELRWDRTPTGEWMRRDRAKEPLNVCDSTVPNMPQVVPDGWTRQEVEVFWHELQRCDGNATIAQRLIVATEVFPRGSSDKYVAIVNALRHEIKGAT